MNEAKPSTLTEVLSNLTNTPNKEKLEDKDFVSITPPPKKPQSRLLIYCYVSPQAHYKLRKILQYLLLILVVYEIYIFGCSKIAYQRRFIHLIYWNLYLSTLYFLFTTTTVKTIGDYMEKMIIQKKLFAKKMIMKLHTYNEKVYLYLNVLVAWQVLLNLVYWATYFGFVNDVDQNQANRVLSGHFYVHTDQEIQMINMIHYAPLLA